MAKFKFQKKEIALEKSNQIFKQFNLPQNYWTISIFLLIFERNTNISIHSNFELIDVYIDDLLDKEAIANDSSSEFSFNNFKEFLSKLSYYLYDNHKDDQYSCSYSELVSFSESLRKNEIRFTIDIENLIELIKEKRILIKKNNRYSFRLNGVFEYFLAYYMKENPTFKDDIIKNKALFLSFKNELELYAGFNSKDTDFLLEIYDITESIYKSICIHLSIDENDIWTNYEINVGKNEENENILIETISKEENYKNDSLNEDEFDNLSPLKIDNSSEVTVKKENKIDLKNINFSHFADSLFILSRVYRNIYTNDINTADTLFKFIIKAHCNFILILFKSFNAIERTDLFDQVIKKILNTLLFLAPIVSGEILKESIGRLDLKKLINKHIEDLKNIKNVEKYEFELFLLYFLLIDLDIEFNINLIEECFDLMVSKKMKHMVLLKSKIITEVRLNNKIELKTKLENMINRLKKPFIKRKIKIIHN